MSRRSATRPRSSSTSRASPRWRIAPGPRSSSTTPSPRPTCAGPSSSAPTWWSPRRPSG
jgi:hypothetical protein